MPPVTFQFAQGQLQPVVVAGATLDDISRALPQGAYTTLRTYGGRRFLDLPHHLARLTESLGLMGGTATLNEQTLRQALRAALATRADDASALVREHVAWALTQEI